MAAEPGGPGRRASGLGWGVGAGVGCFMALLGAMMLLGLQLEGEVAGYRVTVGSRRNSIRKGAAVRAGPAAGNLAPPAAPAAEIAGGDGAGDATAGPSPGSQEGQSGQRQEPELLSDAELRAEVERARKAKLAEESRRVAEARAAEESRRVAEARAREDRKEAWDKAARATAGERAQRIQAQEAAEAAGLPGGEPTPEEASWAAATADHVNNTYGCPEGQGRVPGDFYGDVRRDEDLRRMLRQRSVCKEVIMVVSNKGGLVAAVNAVKNLDKLGLKNYFLVMNDESECRAARAVDLRAAGLARLACVYDSLYSSAAIVQRFKNWNAQGIYRLWTQRWHVAGRAIGEGYNVLCTDSDVGFMHNPYPLFKSAPLKGYHMIVQREGGVPGINVGLLYVQNAARGGPAHHVVLGTARRVLRTLFSDDPEGPAYWNGRKDEGSVWEQAVFNDAFLSCEWREGAPPGAGGRTAARTDAEGCGTAGVVGFPVYRNTYRFTSTRYRYVMKNGDFEFRLPMNQTYGDDANEARDLELWEQIWTGGHGRYRDLPWEWVWRRNPSGLQSPFARPKKVSDFWEYVYGRPWFPDTQEIVVPQGRGPFDPHKTLDRAAAAAEDPTLALDWTAAFPGAPGAEKALSSPPWLFGKWPEGWGGYWTSEPPQAALGHLVTHMSKHLAMREMGWWNYEVEAGVTFPTQRSGVYAPNVKVLALHPDVDLSGLSVEAFHAAVYALMHTAANLGRVPLIPAVDCDHDHSPEWVRRGDRQAERGGWLGVHDRRFLAFGKTDRHHRCEYLAPAVHCRPGERNRFRPTVFYDVDVRYLRAHLRFGMASVELPGGAGDAGPVVLMARGDLLESIRAQGAEKAQVLYVNRVPDVGESCPYHGANGTGAGYHATRRPGCAWVPCNHDRFRPAYDEELARVLW